MIPQYYSKVRDRNDKFGPNRDPRHNPMYYDEDVDSTYSKFSNSYNDESSSESNTVTNVVKYTRNFFRRNSDGYRFNPKILKLIRNKKRYQNAIFRNNSPTSVKMGNNCNKYNVPSKPTADFGILGLDVENTNVDTDEITEIQSSNGLLSLYLNQSNSVRTIILSVVLILTVLLILWILADVVAKLKK